MTRKALATLGHYGATVNIFADTVGGEPVVRCEWREPQLIGPTKRKTATFRGPKREAERQAKAFAEGVIARLTTKSAAPVVRRTVGELWDAYVLAHESDWRPKTAVLAKARWKLFVLHVPATTYADLVSPETLDEWRLSLLTRKRKHGEGMARNQIAHHIQIVKSVWKFALARKLLATNVLDGYAVRKGRDYKPKVIDEYTPEEFGLILGQLYYRQHGQWRAWAAIALDGLLAPRSNALLQLRWSDLDLTARQVTWPGKTDKLGQRRTQPLSRDAVRILRICKVWARRARYTGDWVFFGGDKRSRDADKPYGYSALNRQLHEAAARAKVEWKPYRAMHGLRRMVAKSVLDATGNLELAGRYIGDTDMRVLKKSYLRHRTDDMAPAVKAVGDLPKRNTKGNETATARQDRRAAKNLNH